MWAVEKYIGHWDGYAGDPSTQPNNYYLHSDAAGQFTMLPWGTDQTWDERLRSTPRGACCSIAASATRAARRSTGRRCGRVRDSIAGLDLPRRIDEIVAAIRPWQLADPSPRTDDAQTEVAIARVRQFVAPQARGRRRLARRALRPAAEPALDTVAPPPSTRRRLRASPPRRRGTCPAAAPASRAAGSAGERRPSGGPGAGSDSAARLTAASPASRALRRRRVAPMAEDDSNELFLLDGNSLAYRAFFALPESIATADGRPTNAIYGLASMLVKIIDEHHPGGVVVAWDAGMSGREVTYDLYKAQRKSRPDLLREQWPHLMPLVEAFGYTNVKVEGYEADDVIATAGRARPRGGDPGDGRHRRPRRLPAGRRRDPGDEHLARDHRDQGLRPRGGDRALRRPARAGHRPDGPARRHLRQHPRRPRHRREDRRPAAAEIRHARGRARQRRGGLRRQTQAEPGRARRRRPHVEAAGDAAVRPRDRGRPAARRWRPSPTAAPCASSCASSSCAR